MDGTMRVGFSPFRVILGGSNIDVIPKKTARVAHAGQLRVEIWTKAKFLSSLLM